MFNDTRAQVLANLKFLYGPDVEVITLCLDTIHEESHQAVAVNLHPLNNAIWTKYLHGKPSSSSNYATLNLLRESEKELTKFFSANGNRVPFKGDMAQILTLGCGSRKDSTAEIGVQSDFVFVAAAEPTLPGGTVPEDLTREESPIQEYQVPETPVEETVLDPADEAPRAVTPEPGTFCNGPDPASGEVETPFSGWSSWYTAKKGRKKQKAALTFDLPALVEEYTAEASTEEPSAEVEAYPVECIVEQSPLPEPEIVEEMDLGGAFFSLRKSNMREEKTGQEFLETFDEPVPESESAIENTWGTWGAKTKKSKKMKEGFTFGSVDPVDEAPPPLPEPEPVFEDAWGTWGLTTKKSKKKKEACSFVSVDPVDESPPPPPESEPVAEDIWENWGITTKKSKKKKSKSLEVPSDLATEPEPEPVVDVDIRVTPTKKEEKMRSVLETELDEWAPFSTSKRSKKNEKGEAEMPPGEQSSAAKELSAETLEVPPAPESVKHSGAAILLPQATSTEMATHNVQPPTSRSGQTVVFTIKFPDEINTKPLQAMITLADNTRAAIFDAVHSYIDSKSSLTVMQGVRRLEIKSGAGKNGDVDLSTLEEMMWPEYLEYFRQYTKLPELTVDCFHC